MTTDSTHAPGGYAGGDRAKDGETMSKPAKKPTSKVPRSRKATPLGIAAELRQAIAQAQRQGMTRYAIAKKAGITPIMLARIANGERGMKLETAEKIATALDLQLTLLPIRVTSNDK